MQAKPALAQSASAGKLAASQPVSIKTAPAKGASGSTSAADKMPPTAPSIGRSSQYRGASSSTAPTGPTGPTGPTDRIARPGENGARSLHRDGGENQPAEGDRISRPGHSALPPAQKPALSSQQAKPDSTDKRPALTPQSKPQPPATTGGASPSAGNSSSTSSSRSTPADMYPAIGKLEQLTFGSPKPEMAIEDRLIMLEQAVFATSYPHDSLFDRTERLKSTLLGRTAPPEPSVNPGGLTEPPLGWVDNPMAGNQPDPVEIAYLDEIIEKPENHQKASKVVLDGFALELINFERQRRALGNLEPNHIVQKMAEEHVRDLVERGVVSHSNPKGENPDRRYTLMGGVDAVSENLAVVKTSELGTSHLCKAAVAKMLKQMLVQQDDREALLAPEATHLGVAMERMNEGTSILTCIEVAANRGVMEPLPKSARVGDKIEVVGVLHPPYKFERITVAWEGVSDLPPQEEGGDEPLPYFPPLDFVAYKEKSDKNHDKAIMALKTVGMLAAIAGGMFVPPVALAAPIIMMSGPDPGEVKPVSDVPVKGGVKVNGNAFNAKVTLSNESKEGLYYVTVWANLGADDKPVAVSRRAILVKQIHDEEDVKGDVSVASDEKRDSNAATDQPQSKPGALLDAKPVELKPLEAKPLQLKSVDSPPVDSRATPPDAKPQSAESGDAGKESKSDDSKLETAAGTLELPTSRTHRQVEVEPEEHDSASTEYTEGDSKNTAGQDETTNSGKQTTDDVTLKSESAEK